MVFRTPAVEAEPVQPTLEDGYVALIRDKRTPVVA